MPTMTRADLLALTPLLILAATSLAVLLTPVLRRGRRLAAGLSAFGLAATLIDLVVTPLPLPPNVTSLLVFDGYSRFFAFLITAASLAVVLLAYGYLARREVECEEFYLLILLATLGSVVLAASTHFASFFLGLELLSVSLYTLIAYPRRQAASLEAAAKYLVLAATSSAFLLFGMALVYAGTGTMEFGRLAEAARANPLHPLFSGGLALMATGIAFKLALVPFHMWTPDVYQGAPAPVTAFVATISKGAVFALLFRLFGGLDMHQFRPLLFSFSGIAAASMVGGTLLALLQDNLKRILAYSSIAHLGFLLVAFLASGGDAATAVGFYLVAYFVTMMGALGVVSALSGPERDFEDLRDYRGLLWRRPWLAGTLAAMMLSLAGIPLTAGFFGKFSVLLAGVHSDLWFLVVVLIITSAVGLFYYLRVLVALCTPAGEGGGTSLPFSPGNLVLAILVLLLIWLGVQPAPVVAIIQNMVARSFS